MVKVIGEYYIIQLKKKENKHGFWYTSVTQIWVCERLSPHLIQLGFFANPKGL